MIEAGTRAELAMKGIAQPIRDKDDLKDVFERIITEYELIFGRKIEDSADKIIEDTFQYCEDSEPLYIVVTVANIGKFISIVIEDNESEEPFDMCNIYGVLAYVYNIEIPMFSELGSIGFKKEYSQTLKEHVYRRVF